MQPEHQPVARNDTVIASYLVGQDNEGHWLAVEIHDLDGGICLTRDKAFRYARKGSHRSLGAMRFVDEPIRFSCRDRGGSAGRCSC